MPPVTYDELPQEYLAAELETERGRLVLLAWERTPFREFRSSAANVGLFDRAGRLLWTVDGARDIPHWEPGRDAYVALQGEGDAYLVHTFDAVRWRLDLATGTVTYFDFAK